MPSWHLEQRCCDLDPVLVVFWSRKGTPGTSKIKEFCETSFNICDFAIFNPESILDPILDPPGLRFGSLLAPKMAETCLEIRLGPAKSSSRLLFFGSKRPTRGFQTRGQKRDPKRRGAASPGQTPVGGGLGSPN